MAFFSLSGSVRPVAACSLLLELLAHRLLANTTSSHPTQVVCLTAMGQDISTAQICFTSTIQTFYCATDPDYWTQDQLH